MQTTSWAAALEFTGDDDRLIGHAGALPVRLLAERSGLRAGLSAAMRRRGFDPVYDRGQVLVDLALTLVLGGEAISDFQGLRHLAPVTGPVPSTPTVWRALNEAGDLQLARVNAAVAQVPPVLVGHPGRAAGGVPVAAGRGAGAGRDHRG